MADRLIRITTALAVVAVVAVAAVISYRHAYELVRAHGESGATARLVPFPVDGLIQAASMVILDANRRKLRVQRWPSGASAWASSPPSANVAHGLSHGVTGALVSAWPALALVGSFKLLMTLTRNATSATREAAPHAAVATEPEQAEPARTEVEQSPEEAVLTDCLASLEGPGKPLSQRSLAEKHGVDRRKVRQIISTMAEPEPD